MSAADAFGRRCLDALAADVPLPWCVDEADLPEDRSIVIRDADNGYVCEIDLAEFASLEDDGAQQARAVAALILAAVAGGRAEG